MMQDEFEITAMLVGDQADFYYSVLKILKKFKAIGSKAVFQ